MRRLFIILLFGLLLAQVRVGEMRSITSTLDVRDLITTGQDLFLATAGGLAKYNINSGDYKIYTKDQGMGDTDINIVHLDSKGFVWIGSKMGVQVWDPDQEMIIDWFQLDIEAVTGFSTYNAIPNDKDMIYAAVKNDGVWGIMEFIYSNDKVYYRDFYGRDDISLIKNIITFGDHLFIHTNEGIISGNPHKDHPLNWTNPYPNLDQDILAIDAKEDVLALITSNSIYSIKLGQTPVALVREDVNILSIHSVSVRGEQDFIAISDSVIYEVGTDKLAGKYIDNSFQFKTIATDLSLTWVGTRIGFGQLDGMKFEHIAGNEPFINAPQTIQHLENNRWIMANDVGISMSGWSNVSSNSYSNGLSSELNLEQSTIHLGTQISNMFEHKNKVFIGLINSKSAGVAAIDVSNGIKVDQLYLPKVYSNDSEEIYVVFGVVVDQKDNIWATSANNFNQPISIFNGGQFRHISISESGGVLSNNSHAITVDNYNRIWIGSPAGLVMYKYSGNIMDPTNDLWVTEVVNPGPSKRTPLDINVSSKNRLWILTPLGLIHKDLQVSESNPVSNTGPTGNNGELIPYFSNVSFNEYSRIRFDPRGNVWVTSQKDGVHIVTENGDYWPDINGLNTSNSNLLSNYVNDVTFDSEDGLAYIATDKGVSLVRIPYANEKKSYKSVGIFPSPFRIPNDKPLTIDGLKDNSSLKIMTLNGMLLRSITNSEVNGYQAYWDGRDEKGQLVGSGVYLITVYDNKGVFSMEKVAVIRK